MLYQIHMERQKLSDPDMDKRNGRMVVVAAGRSHMSGCSVKVAGSYLLRLLCPAGLLQLSNYPKCTSCAPGMGERMYANGGRQTALD